jgi:hypothetical protein
VVAVRAVVLVVLEAAVRMVDQEAEDQAAALLEAPEKVVYRWASL